MGVRRSTPGGLRHFGFSRALSFLNSFPYQYFTTAARITNPNQHAASPRILHVALPLTKRLTRWIWRCSLLLLISFKVVLLFHWGFRSRLEAGFGITSVAIDWFTHDTYWLLIYGLARFTPFHFGKHDRLMQYFKAWGGTNSLANAMEFY